MAFYQWHKRRKAYQKLDKQKQQLQQLKVDSKRQRRALSQSIKQKDETQEMFRAITNQSGDGITLVNADGKYLFVNPAFCQISGYSQQELLTMFVRDLSNTASIQSGILYQDDVPASQQNLIRKDQVMLTVEVVSRKITLNNETLYLRTIRDISDKVKLEDELRVAIDKAEESNRLKTGFLQNLSHEIRTPLNGILGFANMLNESLAVEKRKHYIEVIHKSGDQLLRIIEDILEISKLETRQGDFVENEVCLNELLEHIYEKLRSQAAAKNLQFKLHCPLSDKDSSLLSDKRKLYRAIHNVVENAIKFTESGQVDVGYTLKNQEITIYVKDTGLGIPSEKSDIIYERFYQAELDPARTYSGLGLGLTIARKYIEFIGGSITLESTLGSGSTFSLNLPFLPLEEADSIFANKQVDKVKSKDRYQILICEDEEVNFAYIHAVILMDERNYTINRAINGLEAVNFCTENPVDLIFMDLKMPELNGLEATHRIRDIWPQVPIIMQTAYSNDNEEQDALDAGCNEFLVKPIQQQSLLKVLDTYLPPVEK